MSYLDFKRFASRYAAMYNIPLDVYTKYFTLVHDATKEYPDIKDTYNQHAKYLVDQCKSYGIKSAIIDIGDVKESYEEPSGENDDAPIKIYGVKRILV